MPGYPRGLKAEKSNMISQSEIEEAYDHYSDEIFTFIIRSVHDHDEAEDLLQDVFVKLINYSVKSNVNSVNIRALLYSIARSVCIDTARRTKRVSMEQGDMLMVPDKDPGPEGTFNDGVIDMVNSAINTLGEPEKSIILLRKNGLTYAEISPVLKLSERTLKRKVKSAIEQIRKKLRDEGFFIPGDTGSSDESFNR